MPRGCTDNPTCPASRAIAVLQEKWVLHIVHTLLDGPRGFNELGRDAGGCNPTTLTQRLARLEELGLVHRSVECEGGRSAYALTEAGQALRPVVDAIDAWSASYLGEDGVAHGVVVQVPAPGAPGSAATEPAHAPHAAVDPATAPRVAVGQTRIRAHEERSDRLPPMVTKPS